MIALFSRLKRATGARTWQLEAVFVALYLSAVALASGKNWHEWLGVVAVFFTWSHASVADRLAEGPAAERAGVDCHRWARRYWLGKEVAWFAYFAWAGAWSALAGCVLFLVYPLWRRAWRGLDMRRGVAPNARVRMWFNGRIYAPLSFNFTRCTIDSKSIARLELQPTEEAIDQMGGSCSGIVEYEIDGVRFAALNAYCSEWEIVSERGMPVLRVAIQGDEAVML